jgi:hypothetical protein
VFWKLEFQGRGAPHYHLLGRLPNGVQLRVMRQWVARAWFEIVGSGDERHLHAGTAVDAKWREWDNAAAIGFYFSKHGVWSTKEAQHTPPAAWDSTGRWWGAWNLPRIAEVVDVDPSSVVQLRRVMRKWFRSRHQPKLVPGPVEVHDGHEVLRERWIRPSLRSLKGRTDQGAWLLVRNGPEFALALGRAVGYVEQMNGGTRAEEVEEVA